MAAKGGVAALVARFCGGQFPSQWNLNLRHRRFLIVITLQCIFTLIERVYMFVNKAEGSREASGWYLGVALISLVFVVYFAFHGVITRNTYEFVAFFISVLVLTARDGYQYFSHHGCKHSAACLAMLPINSLFILLDIVYFIRISRDMHWELHKSGGDELSQSYAITWFKIFNATHKLDLQFSLLILLTGLVYFCNSTDAMAGLIPLGFVIVIEVAWIWAGRAASREQRVTLMKLFWLLSAALPICVIVIVAIAESSLPQFNSVRDGGEMGTFYILASIFLACRLINIAASLKLYSLFGRSYDPVMKWLRNCTGNTAFVQSLISGEPDDVHSVVGEGDGVSLRLAINPASQPHAYQPPLVSPVSLNGFASESKAGQASGTSAVSNGSSSSRAAVHYYGSLARDESDKFPGAIYVDNLGGDSDEDSVAPSVASRGGGKRKASNNIDAASISMHGLN